MHAQTRLYRKRRSCLKVPLVRVLVVAVIIVILITWRVSASPKHARHRPAAPELPYVTFRESPIELPVARRQPGIEARHVVLSVVTDIDLMACAHFTSAILSGVSPVVSGYTRKFSFHQKFEFAVEALDTLGLRDWDIVLMLDSDTTFTGEDVSAVMKEFDQRAPAHPDDINVRAVRRGEQWAPMIFHSEPNCFAPRVTSAEDCPELYRAVNEAVDSATNATPFRRWIQRPDYLNSGVMLTRVWALREFQRGLELHTQVVPSLIAEECDQSIATGLYLDMLWSEVRLGLVSGSPSPVRGGASRVNQFGLHYGLMALDTEGRLSVPLGYNRYQKILVTGKQHGINLTTMIGADYPQRPRVLRLSEAIVDRSQLNPLFYTKTVPGPDGSGFTTVKLTPSLITRAVETADLLADDTPPLTFPLLIHTPGSPKFYRLSLVMPFSGWSLALRFVPGYCAEARTLVEHSVIRAVVSQSKETLLTVGTVCHKHLPTIFKSVCEL